MKSISKACKITALLLTVIMIISSLAPLSYAANTYSHNPCDNPAAMRDIEPDENAVYGFRPSSTGSLKMYAHADWSDEAVVAQGRAERIAYHKSIESMYDILNEMRAQGKSTEETARAVSTRRNEIRLEAYAGDPEGLAAAKARNLEKYGHEEGPLPDELYAQYGSWEKVMEKAFSTNSGMDACLGLYDDYYFLYVALGDVPADMIITLPDSVKMRAGSSVTLIPTIVTNAAEYSVTFVSGSPDIAAVNAQGEITGLKSGKAEIRCVVTDNGGFEHTSEPCVVQVRMTLWQWIMSLFQRLFKLFEH